MSINDLVDGHAGFTALQLTHQVGYQLHNFITPVESKQSKNKQWESEVLWREQTQLVAVIEKEDCFINL